MIGASQGEHDAFIGLGSNLDAPAEKVRAAMAAIGRLPATRVVDSSSLYRSAPVGYTEQADFINAVARIATGLDPHGLLDALLALEATHGRIRTLRNGPRTLDLDLLLYDQQVIAKPALTVPHPRMHERAFVLMPLAEIAPEVTVPGRGVVSELLKLVGTAGVWRLAQ